MEENPNDIVQTRTSICQWVIDLVTKDAEALSESARGKGGMQAVTTAAFILFSMLPDDERQAIAGATATKDKGRVMRLIGAQWPVRAIRLALELGEDGVSTLEDVVAAMHQQAEAEGSAQMPDGKTSSEASDPQARSRRADTKKHRAAG